EVGFGAGLRRRRPCPHLSEKIGGVTRPRTPQAAIPLGLPAKNAVSASLGVGHARRRARPPARVPGRRTGPPGLPPGHSRLTFPRDPYLSSTSDHLCNRLVSTGREPTRRRPCPPGRPGAWPPLPQGVPSAPAARAVARSRGPHTRRPRPPGSPRVP